MEWTHIIAASGTLLFVAAVLFAAYRENKLYWERVESAINCHLMDPGNLSKEDK